MLPPGRPTPNYQARTDVLAVLLDNLIEGIDFQQGRRHGLWKYTLSIARTPNRLLVVTDLRTETDMPILPVFGTLARPPRGGGALARN